jgi:hypothetical protein
MKAKAPPHLPPLARLRIEPSHHHHRRETRSADWTRMEATNRQLPLPPLLPPPQRLLLPSSHIPRSISCRPISSTTLTRVAIWANPSDFRKWRVSSTPRLRMAGSGWATPRLASGPPPIPPSGRCCTLSHPSTRHLSIYLPSQDSTCCPPPNAFLPFRSVFFSDGVVDDGVFVAIYHAGRPRTRLRSQNR